VVLEGRDRVGGRVWTRSDIAAERTVEFGGELIGANHPYWLAYASRFGLAMADVADDSGKASPVMLGGRMLSPAAADALYDAMAHAEEALTAAAASVDAAAPWRTRDAATLDARSLRGFLRALRLPADAARAIDVTLEANNAVPTRAQSLLANLAAIRAHGLDDYWTQTEVYRCRGGNQQLAVQLAAAIGAARIRLATPVLTIGPRTGGGARVTTARETIDCDVAVLAAPPSVWGRMALDPAPPAPAMGVAFKHFTVARQALWRRQGKSQFALTDAVPTMTWDALDGQSAEGGVLVGFSGGRAAAMASAMGAPARDHAHAHCYEALYPGLAALTTRRLSANWPRDPFAGAGYSFPAPGQVTEMGDLLLRGYPHLRFAGEHVSPGVMGYMEGALETGAHAARAIATA